MQKKSKKKVETEAGLPVPRVHFIECMNLFRDLGEGVWESGFWAVQEDVAEKLVGGVILFHRHWRDPVRSQNSAEAQNAAILAPSVVSMRRSRPTTQPIPQPPGFRDTTTVGTSRSLNAGRQPNQS